VAFDKTDFTDQSLWEAGWCSAYQESPRLLEPITGLCSGPDESIPLYHTLFLQDLF